MEQDIDIKESRNIFKYNGPIGRKGFLISMLAVLAYQIVCILTISVIAFIFDINRYTQIIIITIFSLCFLLSFYIMILAYAKRIYDLICNKNRALFYSIAFYLACISMSFIPILKWFGIVFSLFVMGLMLFKKGKFVVCDKTVTEE